MHQKLGFAVFPPVIPDASSRNEKVNMGMIDELSRPGLKNAHQSDLRTEEPFVLCQKHDRFSRRLEEEMIHDFLMTSEYGP